ncbi:uncharacterized protein LOC144163282 isoform X2 [Haemaphysalis longicornis]
MLIPWTPLRSTAAAATSNSDGGRRLAQCDQCGYRCSSRSYMRIHARVHTGERPFRCDQCPSAFTDPSNLNRHKRCHTGERPFACRHCKQHFSQSSSLRTHMLYQHGDLG